MKNVAVFMVCLCLSALVTCQNITLTKDEIDCIRCICHATSGCHLLTKCAAYHITESYWRDARQPTVSPEDAANATLAYQNCMNNDNCILQTVYDYSNRLGYIDCNCDDRFDCDDRLAIHFNGCENLGAIHMFDRRKEMYENCSKRSMRTRYDNCEREDV